MIRLFYCAISFTTTSKLAKWVFLEDPISEFLICFSPSQNMTKSPRPQKNRCGRFRSITTFIFEVLNKLFILLNKSKNFIKANFLVGPCLRKKMLRNLSFDQNWESFFYYIATLGPIFSVFCNINWESSNIRKVAFCGYLNGVMCKN